MTSEFCLLKDSLTQEFLHLAVFSVISSLGIHKYDTNGMFVGQKHNFSFQTIYVSIKFKISYIIALPGKSLFTVSAAVSW